MSDKPNMALKTLHTAITEHDPSHVFALFSGGHDSLTATAIAARHPRFTAAAHLNTGIGIEDTRQFVRDTCHARNWPLVELHHDTPVYEEMVLEHGFPGPAAHVMAYVRLKERLIDKLIREHKTGHKDRIVLVTGARRDESVRRMLNVSESPIERDGAAVWVNAIHDWTKIDCNRLIEDEGLARNTVVDKIHMSGECKCGAYAHKGEREEDRLWFPEFAAYLDELEARVEAEGRHACIWGAIPPDVHRDQESLFSRRRLCSSCEWRAAA